MIDHFTLDSSVAHQTIGQQLNWNMKNTFIKSCLFGNSVKGVILESGDCFFPAYVHIPLIWVLKFFFFTSHYPSQFFVFSSVNNRYLYRLLIRHLS